ncbi:MAG: flagellar hook-associated protein FlgK [Candidatus Abyssubacteria bacterium]|nr:flagellar hook-associated protein FlgK [Candidatus Abyssubacteria bacterium]
MASSLFSMLSMGASALQTQQILLNIAGQNVANAATEGYTRQRADILQQPDVRIGGLLFGHGSNVALIERIRENLIDDRFRRENSILGEFSVKMNFLTQIEDIIAEPSQEGIAQTISNFFDGLQDLTSNPENEGVRASVRGSAISLADSFNLSFDLLNRLRTTMNESIQSTAYEINRLGAGIAELNRQITALEVGPGTSNASRDARDRMLNELSELTSVEIRHNANGTVNVYIDGYGLVQDFTFNPVDVRFNPDLDPARDDFFEIVAVNGGNRPLDIASGSLRGYIETRDGTATNEVAADLNTLALEIIEEVNRIHSRGQGLAQFQSLTSDFSVTDPDDVLDSTGLPFTPVDGGFFLAVYDSQKQLIEQHEIIIDADTDTLNTVAAAINAEFSGSGVLTATVTANNKLQIETTDPDSRFSFVSDDTQAGDTSDFLLAMGLNSFFTFDPVAGAAATIEVSPMITGDVALIAAGRSTGPGDNSNALELAQLRNASVLGTNTSATLEEFFQTTIISLGFTTRQAIDRVDIQLGVVSGVANLRDSISGVSLDEEAVNTIRAQQAYEASARFVAAVSEVLDILLTQVG